MTHDKIFFKQYLLRSMLLILVGMILIACNNAQTSSLFSQNQPSELTQTSPNIAQTIEYRGTKFGFRLSYPSEWQVLEDPPPLVGDNPDLLHAVTLQPPQDSKSLAVVYIQTLTTTQTLDQYAALQMISLRANESGATFAEPSVTQLGGYDARATSSSDDKSQLRRMVMTLNGSRAYALLLFGPKNDELAVQFDTLVQSFRFLP
jgi:predicted Zn-dependent protease